MSSLYPLPWDLRASAREPELNRLQMDITATGHARGRKRHNRWVFTLQHAHMPETEAIQLQAWYEQHEGQLVQINWRDGRIYEGVLGQWDVDRVIATDWMAHATIHGAEVIT